MSPKEENDIFVENSYKEYFATDLVTFPVLVIGISRWLLLDVVYNFRTDFSKQLLFNVTPNRLKWIGHVRCINILTWLWGFQDKLLYLVLISLYPSLLGF